MPSTQSAEPVKPEGVGGVALTVTTWLVALLVQPRLIVKAFSVKLPLAG